MYSSSIIFPGNVHFSNLAWTWWILCGLCTMNFNDKKLVYRLSFWTPNWGLYTQNIRKNPRDCVGQSEFKRQCNGESCSHITLLSEFDFECWLGYRQASRKMGSALAHKWPQKQSCDNPEQVFGFNAFQTRCHAEDRKDRMSNKKVFARVFLKARCTIHTYYIQKRKPVNCHYFAHLLNQPNEDLKKKGAPLAIKSSFIKTIL